MILRIKKLGSSFALRLPTELALHMGVKEGDWVQANLAVDGGISIRATKWDRGAFAHELEKMGDAMPMTDHGRAATTSTLLMASVHAIEPWRDRRDRREPAGCPISTRQPRSTLLAPLVASEALDMTVPKILNAVSGLLQRPTGQGVSSESRRSTLVELAELAERDGDEFERVLAAAGVPPAPADEDTPTTRRKWSQLHGFDRATFDYDAYIRSLKE